MVEKGKSLPWFKGWQWVDEDYTEVEGTPRALKGGKLNSLLFYQKQQSRVRRGKNKIHSAANGDVQEILGSFETILRDHFCTSAFYQYRTNVQKSECIPAPHPPPPRPHVFCISMVLPPLAHTGVSFLPPFSSETRLLKKKKKKKLFSNQAAKETMQGNGEWNGQGRRVTPGPGKNREKKEKPWRQKMHPCI